MALSKLTAELYQLYEQKQYESCRKLLVPIKIELVRNNLLVAAASNTQTADQVNDLKISERILEIGAFSALYLQDHAGFEATFASLRPFYSSPKLHGNRETNSEATKTIALYLLYLLAQGKTSAFHVELESIYNSPTYNAEKDQYLQFPIELERNLMEGNYIKIWKLLQNKNSIPCKEFDVFTTTLVNTLRYEIARSLEKTNESIPISNCKTLLYFPQEQSDAAFEKALKSELKVEDWEFKGDLIYFPSSKSLNQVTDSSSTIANVLNYAEQIESIV